METDVSGKQIAPDNAITPASRRSFLSTFKKRPLAFVLAFLGFILLILLIALTLILNSKTVYHNVLILGEDVGGLTNENLKNHLEIQLSSSFNNTCFTFSDLQFERTIPISDMGVEIDVSAMANKAYSVGREGNILKRIAAILKLKHNPVFIDIILYTNTVKFNTLLDEICMNVSREIIPSNVVIMEDQVILCTGIPGREADKGKLQEQIVDSILSLNPTEIIIPINKIVPPPLDIETTLYTLNKDPLNAEFVRTSRTTYEITPHQKGLSLDRAKLMEVISYVENRELKEYEEIILPVEFITPDITVEGLEAQLFKDTLSTYTTYFSTNTVNNRNRGINIGLAAKSIDGTILLPGEAFSFNEVVGPRTARKGYQTAHIYVAGQIQDGTGGGVCQVSTTLYNAVLRANLEVTERHNHMFTVGYVPLGHDAAVSYGYADLVFTNTTSYPLRIDAIFNHGGSLTFSLSAANDYPDLKVKLATKTISTTPITVVYVNDYALPMGVEVVAEKGMNGYVVDTYIRIYNDDILLKEEIIHRSVYQMYPRKIRRGEAPAIEIIE